MGLNTLSLAHDFIRRHVQPGTHCIDATAGRGRDTALLCELAGSSGHVWAFDIQQSAIDQTNALLASRGTAARTVTKSVTHCSRMSAPSTTINIRC